MIAALKSLLAWSSGILLLAVAVHMLVVAALPSFMMEAAMGRVSKQNGINAVFHGNRVTSDSRDVVRPSPDLLYSGCAFNLSQTSLRITAQIPEEGYWSLSFFGANTDTFLVLNNQQETKGPIDIILVGPGNFSPVPEDTQRVEAPSFKGIVLLRQLAHDDASFEAADANRAKFTCVPHTS